MKGLFASLAALALTLVLVCAGSPAHAQTAPTLVLNDNTHASNTNITITGDCAAGSRLVVSSWDDSNHITSSFSNSKGDTFSTPVSSIEGQRRIYTSTANLASGMTVAGSDWVKYQLTTGNGTYVNWLSVRCYPSGTGIDHEGDAGTDNAASTYTWTTATATLDTQADLIIASTGGWANPNAPSGWTLLTSFLSGQFGLKVYYKNIASGANSTGTMSPWSGGEHIVSTYTMMTYGSTAVHHNNTTTKAGD